VIFLFDAKREGLVVLCHDDEMGEDFVVRQT
jgi:hypothetical protein